MIAIIKYIGGNVTSMVNAVSRLGYKPVVTNNHDKICKADKVIFPGVGEARTAMDYLKSQNLDSVICNLNQPVLGVCLGLQLMCSHSEERDTNCLGIFNTKVRRFSKSEIVPHMGWNNFEYNDHKLFSGVSTDEDVFFVHSYYAEVCKYTIATSNYNNSFSAALNKDNFYATQFHPEKSGAVGETILKNFLQL